MDPMDDDNAPVWDEDAALASVSGNRALALSLFKDLCATLPQELRILREQRAAGDLPGTAERAHYISGGAAYCGVHALRSRLKLLESHARAGNDTGTGAALSAVAAEVERLLAFAKSLS